MRIDAEWPRSDEFSLVIDLGPGDPATEPGNWGEFGDSNDRAGGFGGNTERTGKPGKKRASGRWSHSTSTDRLGASGGLPATAVQGQVRKKPGVLRLLQGTVVRRRGLHHGGTENTELKMNHSNYLRLLGIQRTMYAQVVLW